MRNRPALQHCSKPLRMRTVQNSNNQPAAVTASAYLRGDCQAGQDLVHTTPLQPRDHASIPQDQQNKTRQLELPHYTRSTPLLLLPCTSAVYEAPMTHMNPGGYATGCCSAAGCCSSAAYCASPAIMASYLQAAATHRKKAGHSYSTSAYCPCSPHPHASTHAELASTDCKLAQTACGQGAPQQSLSTSLDCSQLLAETV
jgi:hypothetical protein